MAAAAPAAASSAEEPREETWQHGQPAEDWVAAGGEADDGKQSWTEFGVQFCVGLVPVVGPAANACYDISQRRYVSAVFNVGSCVLDCVTWGTWAANRAAGSAAFRMADGASKVSAKAVVRDEATKLTVRWGKKGAKVASDIVYKHMFTDLSQEALEESSKKIIAWLVQIGMTEATAKEFAKDVIQEVVEGAAKLGSDALLRAGGYQAVRGLAGGLVTAGIEAYESGGLMGAPIDATCELQPAHADPANLSIQEINGTALLPESKKPRRPLSQSNFLQCYNDCTRSPSRGDIERVLPAKVLNKFQSHMKTHGNDVGKAAAMLWSDSVAYGAINSALITDNKGLLKIWVPIIRTLNNYLLRFHPSRDTTVRRRSWMRRDEALGLPVGASFRLGMYAATSLLTFEQLQEKGLGGREVRVQMNIPVGCFQAREIADVARWRAEKEIVIVPYSGVTVVSKTDDQGIVTIFMQVHKDSRNEPLDMPTILI